MAETVAEVNPEVAQKLRAYGALDNPIRLKAYRLIHDSPDVSFNRIAKELDLATGLAAYHVGILKSAELVDVRFERTGRATSQYHLTALGRQIFDGLFGRQQTGLKGKLKVKVPARIVQGRSRASRP